MSCPLLHKPSPAGYSKVRSLVGPAADSVGAAATQRVPPAHRAVSRFLCQREDSMSCPLLHKPSPAGYSKVRSLVGPAADSVGAFLQEKAYYGIISDPL